MCTGFKWVSGSWVYGYSWSFSQSSSGVTTSSISNTNGTWTPVPTFGGGNTGMVLSSAYGKYSVDDNGVVTAFFFFGMTNKGTSTGTFQMGGLPVPLDSTVDGTGGGLVTAFTNMSSVAEMPEIRVTSGNVQLTKSTGTVYTYLTNSNFTNTTVVYGTFSYKGVSY